MKNKNVAWAWATSDRVLSPKPCWLHYAYLVVSAASTDTHLYNGDNAGGEKITSLVSQSVTGHEFRPPEPVYCSQGLYIDVGTNVTGVFVQWEGEEPAQPAEPAKPPKEFEG